MWYTDIFYKHIMFRHSCGVCPYANTRRPSDITLADFWGWEKVDPKLNKDDKGLSLVLVNTVKGRELFEAIRKDMDVTTVKLEDCLQGNLKKPSEIHPRRMTFEMEYADRGFSYVWKKYRKYGYIWWVDKLGSIARHLKRR